MVASIALLIIVFANIGILILFRTISAKLVEMSRLDRIHDVVLHVTQRKVFDDAIDSQELHNKLIDAIAEDGKKTRKDIQEVKTRLTDDEKDDQQRKAKARAARRTQTTS